MNNKTFDVASLMCYEVLDFDDNLKSINPLEAKFEPIVKWLTTRRQAQPAAKDLDPKHLNPFPLRMRRSFFDPTIIVLQNKINTVIFIRCDNNTVDDIFIYGVAKLEGVALQEFFNTFIRWLINIQNKSPAASYACWCIDSIFISIEKVKVANISDIENYQSKITSFF